MEFNDYIIGLALLYKKIYVGIDRILCDKLIRYQSAVCYNLQGMNSNMRLATAGLDDDLFKIWSCLDDSDGNMYFSIDENINIEEIWNLYIKYLSNVMCMASLKDNALKEIDLIIVDDNIIDRVLYFKQLRESYNLSEIGLPRFDILREWEKLEVDGFVEKYCLTDNERLVLNIMRKNKKDNGYVTVLRKIK